MFETVQDEKPRMDELSKEFRFVGLWLAGLCLLALVVIVGFLGIDSKGIRYLKMNRGVETHLEDRKHPAALLEARNPRR